jgi:hypothetical protein
MKTFTLIFAFIGTTFMASAQTEVGDVILPNIETFGEHKLVLNGAGVREKWWIDMFVGGLYLPQKSSNAKAILESGKPLAVKMHIVSGLINSERMIGAIDDGFRKSTQGNTEPLVHKINEFKGFFKEEINDDDVFDFVYDPDLGVVVYKNDTKLGHVEGEDFRIAFFGIWLSDTPATPEMKEAMLGLAKK